MKTKRFFLPVLFLFLAIGFTACEADQINEELNNTEEVDIQKTDREIDRPGSQNTGSGG